MTLEERITNQLGRRKEMQDRIKAWEKPAPVFSINRTAVGMAIAACLALVLVVYPYMKTENSINLLEQLSIEQPSLADFRAAAPLYAQIDETISQGNYADALPMIEEAMESATAELKRYQNDETAEDESLQYELGLIQSQIYELHWLKIYTLVSLGRNDEAKNSLLAFTEIAGEHQKEALLLLEKLK